MYDETKNGDELEIDLIKELQISVDAMKKIYSYAEAVNTEIAGLLVVDTINELPVVTDALIFSQRASGVEVELDIKSVGREIARLSRTKKLDISKIKGWWHSHNTMDTFWSGTDDDCFDNLSNLFPVVYGIVVNKLGDSKARIDIKTEIGTIKQKNIRLVAKVTDFDKQLMEEAKSSIIKEKGFIQKLVSTPKEVLQWISKDKKEYSIPRK